MAVACAAAVSSHATTYTQFIDPGGWLTETSVLQCQMVHEVPFFGRAVFKTRAGESSRFHLAADSSRLQTGQASLMARSPVWVEQARLVDLGYVPVTEGLQPIALSSAHTERMLAELYDGLEVVFTRRPWYGADESAKVAITTVGFRAAYRQYQACLAGLLPVNFDQIKRTAVYFGSNQYEDIRPSELAKLDNIALYVKNDPTVKEFFIDGHTDSVGTREDNLALAQKRAEEVKRYLVNKGVAENAIVSRWHGERYPVAPNETVAGRAQNRRVTIRLERIEPPAKDS